MPESTEPPLTCVSCEGEIGGWAEYYAGLAFCCAGCVVGGPCTCSYDFELLPAVTEEIARPRVAVPA